MDGTVLPPDGGYGWVVSVCVCVHLSFQSGLTSVFGLLLPYYLETFEHGEVMTVSISSVLFLCMYGSGIPTGVLCDRFGCRTVSMAGSALCIASLFIVSQARQFVVVYIFYGIVLGIGLGLQYIAGLILVQLYFATKRALAIGIATAGIGLGGFIFPPLVRYLLDLYGWRGCLLIMSGLYGHCLVTAILLRPIRRRLITNNAACIDDIIINNTDNHLDDICNTSYVECSIYVSNGLTTSSLTKENESRVTAESYNKDTQQSQKDSKTCNPPSYNQDKNVGDQQNLAKESSQTHLSDKLITFLKELLDPNIVLNFNVIMFVIANVAVAGITVNPIFLPQKGDYLGFSKQGTAWMLSLMATGDVLGRLLFGTIGIKFDNTVLSVISTYACGLSIMLNSFTDSYWFILLLSFLCYIFYGGASAVSMCSLVDYVGPDYFGRAYGLLMIAGAIGYAGVPTFNAYIYSVTDSFMVVFLESSMLVVMSAVALSMLLLFRKCKNTNKI